MRADSFPVELVRGVPVVTAPEEVDITNAAGLRAALAEAAGFEAFVVDMTRTRFCDSAGIQALVDAYRRAQAAGGQVVLALSGTAVPRIFSLTGVDRVIPSFTSVAEALGLSLPGASSIPAVDANHPKMASLSGRRIVEMVWEDLKPRDILHESAFNNAIATVLALGGSTNAVIHMLALAGRAGIRITIDRFLDAVSQYSTAVATEDSVIPAVTSS